MRALYLTLGLLALGGAWLSGLPALAGHAFYAHMTMHMVVVAVAAPCLALAIAGHARDPVRAYPRLFPPVPISLIELVVVWVWHAPALHHFARHEQIGVIIEQATFLLSGVLVWLSAFGGDPLQRAERTGAGIAALLLTSMHMTILGALLALSPRALYAHGDGEMSALEDQHLGGAIMLIAGGIVYLAGGLVLTMQLLKRREARA